MSEANPADADSMHSRDSTGVTPHRRIVDIELLRTIAIAFVLIQHANFCLVFNSPYLLRFLNWGQLWPGVDLFFVISGFLVTSDLLQRIDAHGQFSLEWKAIIRQIVLPFWRRRAWRLWPAAWLWLVLIVAASAFWHDPPFLGPCRANVMHAVAGILFYANYALATTGPNPYGASLPYWSLSVEEQFYFVLPLALILLRRLFPAVIVFAIVLQFPLAHGATYFLFRSDGLLWGSLLAVFRRAHAYQRLEPVFLRSKFFGFGLLILCLTVIFRIAGLGNTTPPFVAGEIAGLCALLVWIATYDRHYLSPTWSRSIVLWVGSRAYVLYLAHMPIYLCSAALAHHIFTPRENIFSGRANSYALAIGLPLLLAAAEFTHRLIEQPFRRFGSKYADRFCALVA